MISEYHCLNCEQEINSESEVVFCNNECLANYILELEELRKTDKSQWFNKKHQLKKV